MKRRLHLSFCRLVGLFFFLFCTLAIRAQIPAFWGMTNGGGTDDVGTIFKIAPDGTGLTTVRSFAYTTAGRSGDELGVQLWQSPAGKLYGVTASGGFYGSGVIFEYDPATGAYVVKYNFNYTDASGYYPVTGLTLASNGKLYGMTSYGGTSNKGVLYEFDYTTSTYTKKVDFIGANGSLPSGGSLYLHTNNKLYGFAAFGGTNDFGVLFEYDPVTNTFTKKIDFTGANGKYPYAGLVRASNGNLYSTTIQGGTNDQGTLFEYNHTTNVLTKRVDFSATNGFAPASALVEADNGRLYAVTAAGGTESKGVLFEFNPATNAYEKRIDFTSANGSAGIGGLLKANNGKLYGLTYSGGSSGYGVLYEYNPSTNTYAKKFDFLLDQSTNTSPNGAFPRSTLMQASNGLLYATASFGGAANSGVLFEYNITTNTYTKKVDFNAAPSGRYPYGGLMRASNGKLYGLTNLGGTTGEGVVFELDPITSAFTVKHNFSRTTGSYPGGTLVQAVNGKLYGMTSNGGSNSDGVLFEFDPATGIYSAKQEFDGSNGGYPFGSLVLASNNKLYGMTNVGGATGVGVLFEYDPATNTLVKKVDFIEATIGSYPSGDLMQATNGKLYGLTYEGGTSGKGVLFEYDISANSISTKVNFNGTNGSKPEGSLLQAPNGKLYGMTGDGGEDNNGVLFEYDISTNTLTKKFDFGGSASAGDQPSGSLALSPNGKLYGGTTYGGENGRGIIFEYDPTTNTVIKKHDFNGANGGGFLYSRLLFVDCIKPATPTIAISNANTESPTLTSSSTSNNQWYRNGVAISGATGSTLLVTQPGSYTVQVMGTGCNSDLSDEQVLVVTNVELNEASTIEVYPNPVSDWLTVSLGELPGTKEVSIVDLTGKKLDSKLELGKEARFNVATYRAGMYLIQVTSEQSTTTKRFVKK